MGFNSLIYFLFMATYAVNAYHPYEMLELSRKPSQIDFDSIEEALTDVVVKDLKSELFNAEGANKDGKGSLVTSNHDLQHSETGMEGTWLEPDDEPSSLYDDPDENDALYSRDYRNHGKRDEYYDSLEKKSHKSTFASPPRKNFYRPPDISDASTSEELPVERKPLEIIDLGDRRHRDKSTLPDVLDAESHYLLDSLDVGGPGEGRSMQTPPWRFSAGKSYPGKQTRDERPTHAPSPEPLITKAAIPKPYNTHKMAPVAPRRPTPKMRHNEGRKYKSSPKPKPFPKEPKYVPKKEKITERSSFGSGIGKATRQQFHEQGTQGPHSYKFGYSTGDKENPMARYEEKDADGIVRGSYSYIDARGAKQVVHYESHPKFGFKSKITSDF